MNYSNAKTTVKIDSAAKTLNFLIREKLETGVKFDSEKHDTYVDLTFNQSDLPKEILEYAILHGLKQKLADGLAFTKEDKASKTTDDAEKALEELWNQLKDGFWNSPTKAGRKPVAPSVKLSDMEAKFLSGVEAGITTWEQANDLYQSITGKELPKPEPVEDDTDDSQDIN